MIRFACICGLRFELPDERAGDEFQCSNCMRLVDVPSPGQMDAFDDDGTVRIADVAPIPPALLEKIRAFGHRDDLRQTVDEYLSLDDAPAADEPPRRPMPRYDPETGELLEQIDLRTQVAVPLPQNIPMAKPTLGYANRSTEPPASTIAWWQLPWKLLRGPNLVSIFMVFLVHAFVHFLLVMPGLIFITPIIVLLIVLAITAHYCNTIEEFGPRQQDEIPAMLRGVSFTEDIRMPLQGLILAYLASFGPLMLLWIIERIFNFESPASEHVLFWLGVLVFPAALLTGVTSGAIGDFLPNRLISVFTASVSQYFMALAVLIGAWFVYGLALGFVEYIPFGQLAAPVATAKVPYLRIIAGLARLYGMLLLAIYLTHLAVAMLGILHRHHHHRFHWIYLEYERDARADTNARLAEMRRRGDPRLNRGRRVMPVQRVTPPAGDQRDVR